VLVFTDPQPESAAEVDFIRDDVVAGLIGNHAAAFGITAGDIMFDDLSLYPRLNGIIGQIGVPWYNIGGNHDLNFEAPDARYWRETFKRTFGPPSYAFEYGGALFLMLDNVDYLGADAARPYSAGLYEGRIGERQLAFIANVLKESCELNENAAAPTPATGTVPLKVPRMLDQSRSASAPTSHWPI
jgi:hypothetical protein